MSHRRISTASLRSEHSTDSDQSNHSNITEEFPDPGLPKRNYEEKSSRLKKTKAESKEVLEEVALEDLTQEEEPKASTKKKESKNKRKSSHGVSGTSKKEAVKKAKEAKKREAQAKKQEAKKALEEEKAAHIESDAFNKIYKPGECLKYITIEIHPALSHAWYMVDSLRELGSIGARVHSDDTISDAGLLVWMRRVPQTFINNVGQVELTSTKQQCPHSLYIMPAEKLSTLATEGRCIRHMVEMQRLAGTNLTLLVFGTTAFCKNLPRGNSTHRMTRENFKQIIADIQIELLVSEKINMLVVETSMELATLILHYTKAIAEAPYKKAKRDIDEQAEFYLRGDSKNCVTVDKEGNGLSRLWEQMIAILPQSSLEVARALGAEYKTPRALLQEFQNGAGIAKLANVGVTRANVPGAKTRRLGPEFAKKLHILFTTEDGDTVIE